MPLSTNVAVASAIFGMTYLGLAVGRVPGLRIDRAGIALVGAAMLAAGVLDFDEAARAVDLRTIVLLLGMMVLVDYLRMAGAFALATDRVARRGFGPFGLLGVVVGLSGVLSAFLVNDVVCVALTPLVLDLYRRLGRRPVPYLVGLATASGAAGRDRGGADAGRRPHRPDPAGAVGGGDRGEVVALGCLLMIAVPGFPVIVGSQTS